MEECLDVLTPDGKKTGTSRPRKEIHRLGLWHRTVHIWLFDEAGNILFQLRASDKESNPGLYDTSCAGHIAAGESSLTSAVREIQEELGILMSETDLTYLFESKQSSSLNGGTYIDNEFYDVYRGELSPGDVLSLTPQPHEVDAFRFFSQSELKRALGKSPEKFVSHPQDFEYLLSL